MSTPEVNTTSEPPGSNPRGAKREACDRCRGQKLRCLRKDQNQDSAQAKCVRCFKAGANCNFGIPNRAGRPPGSSTPSPQQRRGNGSGKSKKGEVGLRRTVTSPSHGGFFDNKADLGHGRRGTQRRSNSGLARDKIVDQESQREAGATIPVHPLSPTMRDTWNVPSEISLDFLAFPESSTATLPSPGRALPPFYTDNGGETSNVEPFGPEYGWAFNQYHAQPMDIHIPIASPIIYNDKTRDVGSNAYLTPPPTCSINVPVSGSLDEAMDLDLPTRKANLTLFSQIKDSNPTSSQARDKARQTLATFTDFAMNSTAKSVLLQNQAEEEVGIKFDEESFSVSEVQLQRMHELSELAMDLYAQIAANNPENCPPLSGSTTSAFQDQLVGDVLKSSNAFLTLLNSFSMPGTMAPSSFAPPPPPPSRNYNNSTYSSSGSSSGASPSTSGFDGDSFLNVDGQVQPSYDKMIPVGSESLLRHPLPADMTTVLQLLVCHIRIIHLHSIMYTRILEYVLTLLPSSMATPPTLKPADFVVPPVFPHMQVGGVSLDQFGMFQIKLLLQISVHVLGEIELTLGLPEGYRVGKSGMVKGRRGILETNVSASFVECLMKERVWRGEKEKVERVRELLESLRKVLKGAIEF